MVTKQTEPEVGLVEGTGTAAATDGEEPPDRGVRPGRRDRGRRSRHRDQRDASRGPGPHRRSELRSGRTPPTWSSISTPAPSRRSRLPSTAGPSTWCHRTVTSWPSLPGCDPIGDDNRLHIYIGNFDGTGVRRVTPPSNGMDEFNPAVDPGGRDRLPRSEPLRRGDRRPVPPGSGQRLDDEAHEPARAVLAPLVHVGELRPDGRSSCSTCPEGRWRVIVVWDLWPIPATGGEPQLVLAGTRAHGSYSPDGTTIAYVGRPRFESERGAFAGTSIWLADADGKHPRLLVMAPGEQEELGWHRAGPPTGTQDRLRRPERGLHRGRGDRPGGEGRSTVERPSGSTTTR